jgi:hypothetical protein
MSATAQFQARRHELRGCVTARSAVASLVGSPQGKRTPSLRIRVGEDPENVVVEDVHVEGTSKRSDQRIPQRLLSQARSEGSSFHGAEWVELSGAQIFMASIFMRIVISA